MLKKHGWIAALFVAVAMVFMACPPGPDNPPEGEYEVIFDLQEVLSTKAVTTTPINSNAGFEEIFGADSWFAQGGNFPDHLSMEIIEDAETELNLLKINALANWGPGVDLIDSVIDFFPHDRVTVKIKMLEDNSATNKYFVLDATHHNGSHPIGANVPWGTQINEWITIERVLTSSDVTAIKTLADPNDARTLRIKAAGAPSGGTQFAIEQITIERLSTAEEVEVCPCCSNGCVGCPDSDTGDCCDCSGCLCVPFTGIIENLELDLEDTYFHASAVAGAPVFNPVVTGNNTSGITLTFTENLQRISFALSQEQIDALMASSKVVVEIDAEATPDGNFRYHLGDPTAGSSWNATNTGIQNQPLSAQLTQELTFSANKKEATLAYFILQFQGSVSTEVTIRSITIKAYVNVCEYCNEFPCVCVAELETVGVKVIGGNLDIVNSGAGFRFTQTKSYGNSIAYFPVNFGDNKLSDYDKIIATIAGVSGDINYKRVGLIASATEMTAYASNTAIYNALVNVTASSPDFDGNNLWAVLGPTQYSFTAGGTAVTIDIDATAAAAYDSASTVYLAIFPNLAQHNDNVPTVITISNVKLEGPNGMIDLDFKCGTCNSVTCTCTKAIPSTAITLARPQTGGTPATTAGNGIGFTAGSVAWTVTAGGAHSGDFAADTAYTATFTLTAAAGYSFTGFDGTFTVANSSSVTPTPAGGGATCTVVVNFPATLSGALADVVIDDVDAIFAFVSTQGTDASKDNSAKTVTIGGGNGLWSFKLSDVVATNFSSYAYLIVEFDVTAVEGASQWNFKSGDGNWSDSVASLNSGNFVAATVGTQTFNFDVSQLDKGGTYGLGGQKNNGTSMTFQIKKITLTMTAP